MSAPARHALVFGASGLTGRHLVLALLAAGAEVTTVTRTERSARQLARWLDGHGVATTPRNILVDFAAGDVPVGGPGAVAEVTELFNCAGAYRFGMSDREAREANVGTVEAIVDLAAALPRVQRVVHVSGYRVGGQDPSAVPWSDEHRRRLYRELGAYEASKVEADAVFQERAEARGVLWTVVNPSSVIGHSVTGESDQLLGIATSLSDLWHGAMPALPGDATTFVPVVTADYLAQFMALLPTDPDTAGRSYWVLDEHTPALPDLLARVASHYAVRVPRLRMPVALIRRLPARITRADPEALSFLASDRYPTGSAVEFAERHGLAMPDTMHSVRAWADHLAAHRFGARQGGARRYRDAGGMPTFELGDPDADAVVLPGLPVNADTWAEVVGDLGARAVDLPGLGLSRGSGLADWPAWLDALTAPAGLHLIGHSIGAAAAILAASAHPERVERLTLVAPFLLQPTPRILPGMTTLTALYLRRASTAQLARRLGIEATRADALEPAVADLRRHRVAGTVAKMLRAASEPWRRELRTMLAAFDRPVHVIVGERDPLTAQGLALVESLPNATVTMIRGAGHHPHLTHAAEVTQAIRAHSG